MLKHQSVQGALVATGTYQIRYQSQVVGRENWDLLRQPEGDYQLNTYLTLNWPVWSYQQAQWLLDARWITRTLDLSFDSGEAWQAAQSSIVAGQWLTRRLSSEGQADEARLPLTSDTQIDFPSPLANFVTLRRIGIEVGTTYSLGVIALSPPGLEPRPVRYDLACLESGALSVAGRQYTAYHFTLSGGEEAGEVSHLWATAQGIVLRLVTADGEDVTELTHLEM